MNESVRHIVRSLFPAWVLCLLLPLPAILFWQSHDGRFIALCCFFIATTSAVVWSFRNDIARGGATPAAENLKRSGVIWRKRMSTVALALLAAWVAFSASCLILNDRHDLIAPVLALASLIPALCIAPYFTLTTRKPLAAVVLTLSALGCMKLVAGGVTCLVYGWHASEHGHTAMTWTHPNLIVWTFLVASGILCASFYVLGARRFRYIYASVTEPGAVPNGGPAASVDNSSVTQGPPSVS